MNNLETYQKIYNLKDLSIDTIKENTITFILLDNKNNYYTLTDDNFIT